MAELSDRRSELAQKLIATQESTLRYISRELHDEFGQILTAIGSMLGRAGAHAPEGSSLRADLQEVREITQNTLEKVRSLSQALHPVMLDEAGLEKTLDWYIPTVERQTGITISYEKSGNAICGGGQRRRTSLPRGPGSVEQCSATLWRERGLGAIALFAARLEVEVEDHGKGFHGQPAKQGIGLVAMRERAELMEGQLGSFASRRKVERWCD